MKLFAKKEPEKKPSSGRVKISFGQAKFTPKQLIVLEKIAEGYNNKEICEELFISKRAVESRIYNIRNLLVKELGYVLNDREMVIFSCKMLSQYARFIAQNAKPQIIDDWESNPHKPFYLKVA